MYRFTAGQGKAFWESQCANFALLRIANEPNSELS
jgi:hypothetical protein